MKYLIIFLALLTTVPSTLFWRWSYNFYHACHSLGGKYSLYKMNDKTEQINVCEGLKAQK